MVAVVGMYILMLKNPEDNLINIPVFIAIIAALAFSLVRAKK
jgi:hypothetical protein